jgi:hypothetical protein
VKYIKLGHQRYHLYLIVGRGNEPLAEVYVLGKQYILTSRRTQRGKIRVIKAV